MINNDIVCIGAGYIGGPTMAVIAYKNPSRKIYVVDINEQRINAWNSDGNLPIYEPGLDDIVKKVRGKNLFFTTDIKGSIEKCRIIFVGVNTPTKTFGKGAGRASDLQHWEETARSIVKYANDDKIIVEKSTLPVKTAESMQAILNASNSHEFIVLSNPEFLAEGSAINDLLNPDRVLIGGPKTANGEKAIDELVKIYEGENKDWCPKDKILTTNVWSAELSKLAANAMLAQRVSSINALSQLCEETGANIDEVANVIGLDNRIGQKFLKAGPGFGGSCFKKDILNLVYLYESFGLKDAAEYWNHIVLMNESQQRRIVERLFHSMFNTLANKKISIYGYAFKANTGDVRETPSGYIVRMLLNEHVRIFITDPKALDNAKNDLADEIESNNVSFSDDPYEIAKDADAILILTDWPEYQNLDWKRIYDCMRKPALVYDARNMLNCEEKLKSLGFKILSIGKKNI